MNLSEHFTLKEMTFSKTAQANKIENKPSEAEIQKLRELCTDTLEVIRARLSLKYAREVAIIVHVGFRNERVNALVGGVPNSQHRKGEAVDFHAEGITVEQLFKDIEELVKLNVIQVDQLIFERAGQKKWIHLSYRKGTNRNQILQLIK